jgi:hypothetical protein
MAESLIIPDTLLDHLRAGQCVAWCGAGISLMSGLPSWSELVTGLIAACEKKGLPSGDCKELHQMLEGKFYDDVVDYCRSFLGTGEYRKFLVGLFRAQRNPSALHQQLARLPFAAVVTTNYDAILENLIAQDRGVIPTILSNEKKDVTELWPMFARNEFFIFKAHGDINRPETVVLSSRDYANLIFGNPGFMQFIQVLFISKSLLFVGTSLSDLYVRRMLEEIRYLSGGVAMPHFAICPRPGPILSRSWRERFNVSVIPYDHEDERAASYEAAVVGVLSQITDGLRK